VTFLATLILDRENTVDQWGESPGNGKWSFLIRAGGHQVVP